jgi:hypothetical protein
MMEAAQLKKSPSWECRPIDGSSLLPNLAGNDNATK